MPKRQRASTPTTYWIDTPAQIETLASPLRHDIGDRLAALGPLTVQSLARALGRRPTSIYHHLKQLEAVGLVRAVKVEGVRGRPAQVYESVATRMRLARAARKPANRRPLARAGAAAALRAARDYGKGFHLPHWAIEGAGRNHWFFRVVARPSPKRLERINRLFDELAELVLTPDPAPGPMISVAWFLSPVGSDTKGLPDDADGRPAGTRRRRAPGRDGARK
jgi:DNA-binding transcriptional ArsR family regulator